MLFSPLFFSVVSVVLGSPSGAPLEGVAAVVNGHVILQSEVNRTTDKFAKAMKEKNQSEALDTEEAMRRKILDQLINDYLVEEETARMGLSANDGAIDGAIAQVMKQNGFASLADLKKALSKEGMEFEEYRASIKKQIETYRLMNETIRSKIQITEQDIQAEFQRQKNSESPSMLTRLKMIFKKKGSPGSDKKGMERLLRQINSGVPFETVANRETEGPGKGEGGSVGAVNPDEMQPELARAIKAMKEGEISEVIQTAQGAYILLVVGREKAATPAMSESVRREISEKLTNEETARQFDSFIRGLREKAQVEVQM